MNKYIIFDLDETIGHFTQLGIFWDTIQVVLNKKLNQSYFNKLCNLYSKFFRPGIFSIFKYLIHCKKKNKNIKVVIYTNNQGEKTWTILIKNYISQKLNYLNLFDKVICAFKVDGQQIEMCRTTHDKTIHDFIRCTKAPKNSRFIFLDDQYHDKMRSNLVDYINIKPYSFNIPYVKMIDRFLHSNLGKELVHYNYYDFKNKIIREVNRYKFNTYEKSIQEIKVDKIVTKQMMIYIQNFIKKKINFSKKNTKKNKFYISLHKTRKNFS